MEIVRIGVHSYASEFYPWMKSILTTTVNKYVQGDPTPIKEKRKLYHIDPEDNKGVYFLAGLEGDVIAKAEEKGITVTYADARVFGDNTYKACIENMPTDLRYKQAEVIDKLSTADKGIILCTTGFGKSFIIKHMCNLFPNATFTIFSYKADVVNSLYNDLVSLLGKSEVGLLKSGTSVEEESKRIQVSTNRSIFRSHIKTCDFILADEVHNVGDNQVSDVLMNGVGHARMFGFTASLHRGDKALKVIEGLFGKPLVEVDYKEATDNGMVVKIIANMYTYDMPYTPIETAYKSTNDKIWYWNNKYRNAKIAEVCNIIPENEQVLIMVNTLSHAIALHKYLPDFQVISANTSTSKAKQVMTCWEPSEAPKQLLAMNKVSKSVVELTLDKDVYKDKAGKVYTLDQVFKAYQTLESKPCGSFKKVKQDLTDEEKKYVLSPKDRARLTKEFSEGKLKKVISTKVFSEGVNFPNLRHFFRVNGSASKVDSIQMPGRLSRLCSGKNVTYLHDLYDNFNSTVRYASKQRYEVYKEQGWFDNE